MKVIKDRDLALLTGVWGLKNQYYLTLSGLTCFDLDHPEIPLLEKEMWALVKKALGKGQVLDAGMPKGNGEVLAYGQCHAPDGKTRPASTVSIRVGPIEKKLLVFGNRNWKMMGERAVGVTDPEPFVTMPITYKYAFGGPEFERNPVGKGTAPVQDDSGKSLHPLPNIENPDRVIGSHKDRPDPAGFEPYPVDWPQRRRYTGTYDQVWLDTRWPFYPEDFNPAFFNTGPRDQQVKGYFKGGEEVEIVNMHPEEAVIRSRLPGDRIRFFLTRAKTPASGPEDTVFEEIKAQLDTVWLFPEWKKGIILYRGTAPTVDDEGSDAIRVYLAREEPDQTPQPIEYYLEDQKRRLDRTVRVDQTPIDRAKEKLAATLDRFAKLPEEIAQKQAQAFGRVPKNPPTTPAEKFESARNQLANTSAFLDRMETMAGQFRKQYGHMVKVNTGSIDHMRKKLGDLSEKIDQAQARVEEETAKALEAKKNIEAHARAQAPKLKAAGADVDVDAVLKGPPGERWRKAAFTFLEKCRRHMAESPEIQAPVQALGLNAGTRRKYYLGYHPETSRPDPDTWGWENSTDPVEIPAGMVIPYFKGGQPAGIVIRPGDPLDTSQDRVIKGSKDIPLMLGSGEGRACLRVAGDMEALLVHQETRGLVTVVALKDPVPPADDDMAGQIKDAPIFLVLFSSLEKEGREKWPDWTAAFPNAVRIDPPEGLDPIPARQAGVDLEKWIRDALPEGMVPPETPKTKPEDLKPGAPLPKLDIGGMRAAFEKEGRAMAARIKAEAGIKKNEIIETGKTAVKKAGLDPGPLSDPPKVPSVKELIAGSSAMAAALAQSRDRLKAADKLTPELDRQYQEHMGKIKAMAQKSAAHFEKGQAEIEAASKKLAHPMPEWAREMQKEQGINPETGAYLSREEVIERYQRGESLSGKNLSGLDLSGLDLSGIDLSRANLMKTKFIGTKLEGADISGILGNGADFSQAVLQKARIVNSLLSKAILKEADLSEADLSRSLLQEADLTGARLFKTTLRLTFFNKTILSGVEFKETRGGRAVFKEAVVDQAVFTGADLTKAVFMNMALDQADFSGVTAPTASFMAVSGRKVCFARSHLDGVRFIKGSSLPEVDFTQCDFGKACFMNSEFEAADFRGSRFHKGYIQNCKLTSANFHHVPAHHTRFLKSDLTGADMVGLNLFQGSFRKTRLTETNLTGSNLFGVDFFKSILGHTRFDLANLKRTQLENRTDLLK